MNIEKLINIFQPNKGYKTLIINYIIYLRKVKSKRST